MSRDALLAEARLQLDDYLRLHGEEAAGLQGLIEQLAQDPGILARSNMRGHITTSALVYDESSDRLLMIHHRLLGRWLQPGGHHEGLEGLQASGAREAAEVTGARGFSAWPPAAEPPTPLDIDSHRIPANPAKGEGEHVHHDFIFLFRLDARAELSPQWAEVKGVRWMPRSEFAALPEPRFARLAAKLRALRPASPSRD